MVSALTKNILFYVGLLISVFAVAIYLSFGIFGETELDWRRSVIRAVAIVFIFLVGYFAQRLLSLVLEPAIQIDEITQGVGGNEYVVLRNSDAYSHPELKVFFEIYDTITYQQAGVRSAFLIKAANVSIGSISRGHGQKNPGILRVAVPPDIMQLLVTTRPGTTAQLEIKVTSVHRLTSGRGLSSRVVTVPTKNSVVSSSIP